MRTRSVEGGRPPLASGAVQAVSAPCGLVMASLLFGGVLFAAASIG